MNNGRIESTGGQRKLPADLVSSVPEPPSSCSHDVVRTPTKLRSRTSSGYLVIPSLPRQPFGPLSASIGLFVLQAIVTPPSRLDRDFGSSIRSSTSCSNRRILTMSTTEILTSRASNAAILAMNAGRLSGRSLLEVGALVQGLRQA